MYYIDGHQAAPYPVPGPVDRGHAPLTKSGQEVVSVGQCLPDRIRHRFLPACRGRTQATGYADAAPGELGGYGSVVLEHKWQVDFPAPEETIVVSRCGVDILSFGHRQNRSSPVSK